MYTPEEWDDILGKELPHLNLRYIGECLDIHEICPTEHVKECNVDFSLCRIR